MKRLYEILQVTKLAGGNSDVENSTLIIRGYH